MFRDPEKRAAKRRAQKEAQARGSIMNARENTDAHGGQMTHASSGKAIKKRRHGERQIEAKRPSEVEE